MERLTTVIKGNIIYPKDISAFSIIKKEIKDIPLKEAVELFEKQYIKGVLDASGGNRKKAAKKLGIHRNTLQKKLSD